MFVLMQVVGGLLGYAAVRLLFPTTAFTTATPQPGATQPERSS
jgi:hypothetical protein